MKAVVLVPGLMGCRLAKPGINDRAGEEVWPPTIIEFITGYERLDDLLRGDLVATRILGNVSFKAVYSPLEALIAESGFLPDGTEKFSAPFIYDWRRDIIESAEQLAEHLDQVAREGADEITIIAHSMGGLVARLALEDPRSQGRRGISRTVLLVTVGTPHSGAPLALARALGLDGGVGISAKGFKRISTDPRYPSGYQLLPTPDDAACWDQASGDLRPIDIYDPTKAARLGLVPDMVEHASNLHRRLREGVPPAKLRYISTAGTGQKTVTRINAWLGDRTMTADVRFHLTRTADGGDGTVPVTSASPRGQRQVIVGEHMSLFAESGFRQLYRRLLGTSMTGALEGAIAPNQVEAALSVEALTFASGQAVGVTLSFSYAASGEPAWITDGITGRLILERRDRATSDYVTARETPIDYAGPSLSRLSFDIVPPDQPGIYRIRFLGKPLDAPHTAFAVGAG